MGQPGIAVLYDITSAVNTALDTGALGQVLTPVMMTGVGGIGSYMQQGTQQPPETALGLTAFATTAGTVQLTPYDADDTGAYIQRAVPPAAAAMQVCDWGQGSGVATGEAAAGIAINGIVPRRARFTTGAVVGQTVRLRVIAKVQG